MTASSAAASARGAPLRLKQLLGGMQSCRRSSAPSWRFWLVRLRAILLRQDRIFSDIIIKNSNVHKRWHDNGARLEMSLKQVEAIITPGR
jgi:hypothetical protein